MFMFVDLKIEFEIELFWSIREPSMFFFDLWRSLAQLSVCAVNIVGAIEIL